jgi:tetratricopeptide (TPR) repeat protein
MLLGISSAIAQNRSTISGFVFDPERRPVGQIFVELSNDFTVIGRMRTDGSGRFFFSGLAHGRYSIKALTFGTNFNEQSVEVEIAGTGVRGQAVADNVQRDIYLRVRKTANSAPFQNAVIFAQEIPKEAEALYKSAVSDLDSNREQVGIEGLVKAISVFPEYFLALQRLGVMRLKEERYKDAVELFKRALAVNDRCFDCLYGIGYAHFTIREFSDAVAACEKATNNKPDSFEAHLLLGKSRRMTKDFANAEKAMKQAAKLSDGASPDVHWNLALLYGKDMNRFEDAAKELELFLKAAPEAPNKEDIKKLIKQFREKAKGTS